MSQRTTFVNRIRIVAVLLFVVAVVLVLRLYSLQVMHGAQFRAEAEGQYVAPSTNYFDRGSIFFTPREGVPISAATIDTGFILAIVPDEIEDPSQVHQAISEHMELDTESFFKKVGRKGDPYEEIARQVPLSVGHAIRKEELSGVRLYREQWRTYPGGTSAAHTIGFMGYGTTDTLSGQYGLERFYDEVLTKPNTGLYVNFFADIFDGIHSTIFDNQDKPGADVITGIEPTVQAFLEGLLSRYSEEWQPEEVGAIILDPKTGSVVALAALPSFDPNNIKEADPNTLANPLVEKVYEFGSIVKPLTVAAGIDANVITPETEYTDRGYAEYDTARIQNFDGKARGVVSMQEVLNQSLNTGVAYIVEELGTSAFRDYFDAFGIRTETGIDLPNEAEPLVSNLESPRTIEYVTASFGQGIAMTPIAMARSLAVLANDGFLVRPHIGTTLKYPGGIRKNIGFGEEERVLQSASVESTTRMLVEVVDTALRGGTVMIPELSVAAKTGTAQIARPDERGYYEDRYLHSFFGYFPAYEPQFLIFLYAMAPQGARYASETWTEPFMEGVRFLNTYYDIEPDRVPTF